MKETRELSRIELPEGRFMARLETKFRAGHRAIEIPVDAETNCGHPAFTDFLVVASDFQFRCPQIAGILPPGAIFTISHQN